MPEAMAVPLAGLLCRREGEGSVPLEGVEIEATVKDYASRVVVSQRYRNAEKKPLEVVYVFPLDEAAAVCGFEAVIDGAHVVGEVKERDQAFARYDDALAAGHGAFLLDQERPDVFTASIGNLPPGKEVLVRITYVAELPREGDHVRFTLPTTVAPRYAPLPDRSGVGRSPAATLNPPVAFAVPYGLELRVEIEMASEITGLESASHPLSVETRGKTATVRLGERRAALDRDFVLLIRTQAPQEPRAVLETDPRGGTMALLSFEPRFESAPQAGEYVFLLDRSGSMDGPSITEARDALQLCLRGLRAGSLFNVVGFGSTFEKVFAESRSYDEHSLAEASRAVARFEANLGGTEILPPLEWILTRPAPPGRARQLFVLTDGQVTNTEEVIALVRKHSEATRVFTFGIGAGASAHLVRGMARAGEGEAEFIAPGERLEEKVTRQMKRAYAPALTDLSIDWGGLEVKEAPHRLPPLFAGGRVLVYGRLEEARPTEVTLRAKGPEGPLAYSVHLDPSAAVPSSLVGTLWARSAIRDLEEGRSPLHDRRGSLQERMGQDRVQAEIVRLGTAYGLVSSRTSFVAVEHREKPFEEEAVLRRVPVALVRGWGATGGARGGVRGGPPMLASARGMADQEPSETMTFGAPTLDGSPALPTPRARPSSSLVDRLRSVLGGAPALTQAAPLQRLVVLQRADGSWDLTKDLAAVLGRSLGDLEGSLQAEGDRTEARRAWATALALVWLERRPDDAALFDMGADKAGEWLARTSARPRDGGDWLVKARAFLR